MSLISSTGGMYLGQSNNIDLAKILADLRDAQVQSKILPIQNEEKDVNAKISAYGVLTTNLTKLQEALKSLQDPGVFDKSKVTGNFDAFEVNTHAGAPEGSYQVSVEQLAQANSIVTGEVTDPKAHLGSGSLDVTVAGQHVKLDLQNASLEDVQKALNDAKGPDGKPLNLNASIVKTDKNSYRLMISATETGLDNAVTEVKFTASDQSSSAMTQAFDQQKEVNKAQDAKLTVNGLTIQQSSNHVQNLMGGIDLDLTTETKGKTQQFTITKDMSATSKSIQSFVDAYNSFIDLVNKASALNDPKDQSKNGILINDSTLRKLKNDIVTSLGADEILGSLSMYGIKADPKDKGKLSIDSDQLNKSLKENPNELINTFVGKDYKSGMLEKLNKVISTTLDKNDGTFKHVNDSLNQQLNKLEDKEDKAAKMIDIVMTRYQKQFTALDQLMTKMQQLSDQLTQQFSPEKK